MVLFVLSQQNTFQAIIGHFHQDRKVKTKQTDACHLLERTTFLGLWASLNMSVLSSWKELCQYPWVSAVVSSNQNVEGLMSGVCLALARTGIVACVQEESCGMERSPWGLRGLWMALRSPQISSPGLCLLEPRRKHSWGNPTQAPPGLVQWVAFLKYDSTLSSQETTKQSGKGTQLPDFLGVRWGLCTHGL